jgi:hypothetical protein
VSIASDGAVDEGAGAEVRERATAVEQIAISKIAREKARRIRTSGKRKKKLTRQHAYYKPTSCRKGSFFEGRN